MHIKMMIGLMVIVQQTKISDESVNVSKATNGALDEFSFFFFLNYENSLKMKIIFKLVYEQ